MPQDSYHVALTGHRPHKLAGYDLRAPFYVALQAWLEEIIESGLAKHEHLTLHSGLALGADAVWSKAILARRAAHPGRVAFVAEVPVMTQSSKWPSARDRAFWQEQIDTADAVNVYAEQYSPRAMQLRNEGMVRASDLLLAVWDGSPSGTGHAVAFAESVGVKTFRLGIDQIKAREGAR